MQPQSPASKQIKFNPTENPNCAECAVKYDKFHLLMNCKKLELYQTNLKAMINDTIQMHCDKPVIMNFSLEKPFYLTEREKLIRSFLVYICIYLCFCKLSCSLLLNK